jgi:hypothetical protein
MLVGFVRDGNKRTSNLAADVENEFSAVYLTSLDGRPISEAGRMMLTTTARATLTGFEWNRDRKTVKTWGRAPTAIEPVTGSVTLSNLARAKSVTITPLAAEGRPLGPPKTIDVVDSVCRLPIGEAVTTWYVIEVEHQPWGQ